MMQSSFISLLLLFAYCGGVAGFSVTNCALARGPLLRSARGAFSPAVQSRPRSQRCAQVAPMMAAKQTVRLDESDTFRSLICVFVMTDCEQTDGRDVQFKNFDDMLANSDKPVLVDFYAVWCGPCVMMSRELVTLGAELGDKISIVKIDTDKYPNIASRFQIAALPTCVLFKQGQPVERIEGVVQAKQLKEMIESKL